MEDQGIMALGPGMQAPTAQPAAQGLPPEAMAAFEQARGSLTPEQASLDTLAAMQEADPALVQEFRQALAGMQLPPEIIDALGQLVDTILANPQEYKAIRDDILSDPEVADALDDFLPEQFDPAFFAGLNIALDELASQTAPPIQQFAMGGIAQLTPIAAEMSRMGRNGDTTMAHVTPSEARLLRMRGGSGTINPMTGRPEYFLKSAFKGVTNIVKSTVKTVSKIVKSTVKGIGSAIKKVASSPIGRIALTAAAMYFGGPMVANFVGATAAPAVTAGLTNTAIGLAQGKKFSQALKEGAIAGALVYGGQQLTSFVAGPPTDVAAPISSLEGQISGMTTPIPNAGVVTTSIPGTADLAGQSLTSGGGYFGGIGSTAPTASSFAPDYSLFGGATPVATSAAAPIPGVSAAAGMPGAASGQFTAIVPGTPMSHNIYSQMLGSTAPAASSTFLGELGAAGQNLAAGNYLNAAGNVGSAFFGTPTRAVASTLGGLALMGGFDPIQPEPLNMVPQETGSDLLRQQPDIYGTQPGGAETTYAPGGSMVQYLPGGGTTTYDPRATGQTYDPRFMSPYFQVRSPLYGLASLSPSPYPRTGFADGGIASVMGYRKGGQPRNFPRKNGAINGPGTGTSDSIPAMLSDGEFVMTAKAVRGAGAGSRREGARRMYEMMRKFERNA
jgi:hypothetical protein